MSVPIRKYDIVNIFEENMTILANNKQKLYVKK